MSTKRNKKRNYRKDPLGYSDYFQETRSPSLSLVYIAPLVLAYEIALRVLDPGARADLDARVLDLMWYFGPAAKYCHLALAVLCLGAIAAVFKRNSPYMRYLPIFLAEAFVLAVLIGPVALWITSLGKITSAAPPPPPAEIVPAMLASVGAGIYEELLFRFILIGSLFTLLHRALTVERTVSVVVAVVLSAAAFSYFHHLGPNGEPFDLHALGFRFTAGIILGALFLVRGLGIVVYLHVCYDLLYDLRGVLFTG